MGSSYEETLIVVLLALAVLVRPSEQTALASACPAVNNQVPFYFDPSVAAGSTVINAPVGEYQEPDHTNACYYSSRMHYV